MIRKFTLLVVSVLLAVAAKSQTIYEGFESGVVPVEWKVINNNNDSGKWRTSGYANMFGAYGVELKKKWNESFDDYLISPKFVVKEGDQLSFYARSLSNEDKGAFKVLVSKGARIISDLNIVVADIPEKNMEWQKFTYTLTDNASISAGDEICFAIYAYDKGKSNLRMDAFVVDVVQTAPKASLSKTAVTIDAEVGISSTSEYITITNTGKDGLVISEVTNLLGTAFSTTCTSDATASLNLKQHESFSFNFSFKPEEAKSYEKDFVIETNGGDITIKLTGNGKAKVPAVDNLTEEFEGDDIPANWTVYDGNNDNSSWKINNSENHSGSRSAECKRSMSYENNDWLVSPLLKVKNGSVLTFYARSSFRLDNDQMQVVASKTGKDFSKDFSIEVLPKQKVPSSSYRKYNIVLSDIAGINADDEIFVAIKSVSAKGSYSLYVDDFKLEAPKDVAININNWETVSEINKTSNSGDIFKIGNNTAETVRVESISDVSPFTLSLSVGDEINAGESKKFSITYKPTEVNIHTKEVVIKTSHGNVSINLKGESKAPQIASTKIEEDFEGGVLPENWIIHNVNDDNNSWKLSDKSYNAHGGRYSVLIEQHSVNVHNDLLVLPKLKVEDGCRFKVWLSGFNDNSQIINIKASKSGNDAADFNITVKSDYTVLKDWTELDIVLTDNANINAGDEIYLAIQAISEPITGVLPAKLIVDDIFVGADSGQSNMALITKFNLPGQIGETVIDSYANRVIVTMPGNIDVSNLKPVIEVSKGATVTPDGNTTQDFNSNVEYKVTAENGDTRTWTVLVDKKIIPGDNKILKFSVDGQIGDTEISHDAKTVSLKLPYNSDLSSVKPTIIVSAGATVTPASNAAVDFSSGSINYTVQASTGEQAVYKVTITKENPAKDISVSVDKPEYIKVPKTQAKFTFKANIQNGGIDVTTPLNVDFTVEGYSYTNSSALKIPFAAGSTQTVVAGEEFVAKKGLFKMKATVNYTDDDISNNSATMMYEVTDSVMARENANPDIYKDIAVNGEGAQMFELVSKDTINSVTLMLTTNKNSAGDAFVEEKSVIAIKIYKFNGTKPTDLVYESGKQEFASTGFTKHTFSLDKQVILNEGKYVFSVVNMGSTALKLAATSKVFTENTVFINNTTDWIVATNASQYTFVIQPNVLAGKKFKNTTTSVDSEDHNNVIIYPNPVQSILTIENVNGALVRVMNTQGVVMYSAKSDSDIYRIDTNRFKNGVYIINILNGKTSQNKKVIFR